MNNLTETRMINFLLNILNMRRRQGYHKFGINKWSLLSRMCPQLEIVSKYKYSIVLESLVS